MKGGCMATGRKRAIGWFAAGFLCIALAVFMMIRPDSFKQILLIALGAVALISSVISLTTIRRYQRSRFTFSSTLVKGITGLIIGILSVILPIFASREIWNLVMYILGAQFALGSVILFIDAASLKDTEFLSRPVYMEGVISLLIALLLFIFPRQVASLLITLLAIIIAVVGITFIFIGYFSSKRKKNADVETSFEVLKED